MKFRAKFAADGNSAEFAYGNDGTRWLAGQGGFGGGTLKLQTMIGNANDDTTQTWRDVAGFTALTAVGHQAVLLPAGKYRFNVAGSTTPTIVATAGD